LLTRCFEQRSKLVQESWKVIKPRTAADGEAIQQKPAIVAHERTGVFWDGDITAAVAVEATGGMVRIVASCF
jgi:hypothetical protein